MNRFIFILIGAFAAVAAAVWALTQSRPGFDATLLTATNAGLAVVTALSYLMVQRSLKGRPAGFVGGVYAGTMLKLLLLGGGLAVYFVFLKAPVHKPSIAVVFGMYLVYTIIEKTALQSLARRPRSNAS